MMDPQQPSLAANSASYRVAAYKPDCGFDASGIGVLLGVLMLAGTLLGVVLYFVSTIFWLVVLFPILAGVLLGKIGARAVGFARIRNPLVGGLAGLVAGVVTMTAMHYSGYVHFQTVIESQLKAAPPESQRLFALSETELRELLATEPTEKQNDVIAAWHVVHTDSFLAYMDLQAQDGVQIGHVGSKGSNLGYTGSWIYWAVEVLIVAGLTFSMVKGATAEPYCANCDRWKPARVIGGFAAPAAQVKAALASGSLSQLAQCGATSQPPLVSGIVAKLAHCPHCAATATVDVQLQSLSTDSKGKAKRATLAHVSYPPQALADLEGLFAPSAPSQTLTPPSSPSLG